MNYGSKTDKSLNGAASFIWTTVDTNAGFAEYEQNQCNICGFSPHLSIVSREALFAVQMPAYFKSPMATIPHGTQIQPKGPAPRPQKLTTFQPAGEPSGGPQQVLAQQASE